MALTSVLPSADDANGLAIQEDRDHFEDHVEVAGHVDHAGRLVFDSVDQKHVKDLEDVHVFAVWMLMMLVIPMLLWTFVGDHDDQVDQEGDDTLEEVLMVMHKRNGVDFTIIQVIRMTSLMLMALQIRRIMTMLKITC